jgi:hypothetical protein
VDFAKQTIVVRRNYTAKAGRPGSRTRDWNPQHPTGLPWPDHHPRVGGSSPSSGIPFPSGDREFVAARRVRYWPLSVPNFLSFLAPKRWARLNRPMNRLRLMNVVRRIDRVVFNPHDPGQRWRGVGSDANLRVLRFGSCEFRAMPRSHTIFADVGYPKNLCELLGQAGIRMEFSNVFVLDLDALPQTPDQLRKHVHLSGSPDVVLVQVGMRYAYRTVFGAGDRLNLIRDRIGRGLGPIIFPAYRLVSPTTRRLGRCDLSYEGPQRLGDFGRLLTQEWPGARVIVVGLFPVLLDAAFCRRVQQHVSADLLAYAQSIGVETVPMDDVVPPRREMYCANGAQLSELGGAAVGQALAEQILNGSAHRGEPSDSRHPSEAIAKRRPSAQEPPCYGRGSDSIGRTRVITESAEIDRRREDVFA